ncbi:MAG: patatin-like phospholipase family protein [Candidatus Melainabacteria bacterium]|nr:patatin-like phospholipase family protein [Candidatus Melainabacteria bacterium]
MSIAIDFGFEFLRTKPYKVLLCTVVNAFFLLCSGASCLAQDPPAEPIKHQLNASNEPKVGLVLGGGGARGAAHVGVLKILEQEGIRIDCITGVNIGAVVGGLYSAGVSISYLEEMFTKKSLMRSYLTVPVSVRVLALPVFLIPRLMGKRGYDGLYKGNHFRNYLNRYVPQSESDISDSKIPFGAVALNLVDGKITTLRTGNLGTALQASSAIPLLRKPVKINNGLYVDGGVTNNLPVAEAKAMGADIVIAVDLDDPGKAPEEAELMKLGTVSHRVVVLHLANVDKEQCKLANVLIRPELADIGLMSESSKDAHTAELAGERAALEALPAIKKALKEAGIATP